MPKSFSLLSWNVQRPGRRRVPSVIEVIASRSPDILTLQEANDALVEHLAELGYRHCVYGRDGDYPAGSRDRVPSHAAVIASRWPLEPDVGWTSAACYPSLFARAHVEVPTGLVDVVTAHIPNGASNGWRKVVHCQVLGRVLRDAAPGPRVLTGDFNEPQRVLADGRVVSHAATIRDRSLSLNLNGDVQKGTEGIAGPHTRREWDRSVCDLFSPEFHGLTHALQRTRGSLRPMPVTHETRSNRRFFDHAFVSQDLKVSVEYLHDLRRPELSDHSAIWLELAHQRVPDVPDW